MTEIQKLSGGSPLECGHTQVLSEYRQKIAAAGYDQFKVFCIECDDWTKVTANWPPQSTEG